jgi:hypothetical protein
MNLGRSGLSFRRTSQAVSRTVMRETLNQSLKVFKATEDIAIEYIRLRLTDSADLVFSSREDRDRVRKHSRWLTAAMPEVRMRSK